MALLAMDSLQEAFSKVYNQSADHIATAPGRVNIIGEHIDYCGFSVLPCALDRCVRIAISKRRDEVSSNVRNTASTHYPSKSFVVIERYAELLDNALTTRVWSDYIVCGAYAASKYLTRDTTYDADSAVVKRMSEIATGLCVLVSGNIPAGAGLSSSSALVVASCLAILSYHTSPDLSLVAECCMEAEQLIGTMGGGMDQAVCCLGRDNHALHVHFSPFNVSSIPLPPAIALVICDSLVTAEKAQGARRAFNTRVCECRLAALIFSQHLDATRVKTLQQVVHIYLAQQKSQCSEVDAVLALASYCTDVFSLECYTFSDISQIIGPDELNVYFTTEQISLLRSTSSLYLRQRAVHVFTEAARVLKFCDLCRHTDWAVAGNDKLLQLGRWMSDSHESLRTQYNCSCVEMDELVECCMSGGAVGARLTGAGWGGCAVAMIRIDDKDSFVEHLYNSYYDKRGVDGDTMDNVVFVANVSSGARIER